MPDRTEQAVALLLTVAGLVIGVMLASSAAARGLAGSYRCAHLIPVQALKTVTGRTYVPAPANASQRGSRVNCVFTPLPHYPLPPAMRHGELTLTVSSEPADATRLRRTYSGRLHPLAGLGSSAIETVSSTGMQQIVAIGPEFELVLRAYGPMGFPMEEQIARHIYAAAAR